MDGTARFQRHSSGALFYREDVLVNGTHEAFQERLYQLNPPFISVYPPQDLSLSAPLMTLRPSSRGFEGAFLCGQDHYECVFSFDLPQGFRSFFKVRGPRKHYDLETTYARP